MLRDPAPEVELQDLRNGMLFVLQVWSTQYLQGEGRLKSELNFAIREKLKRHGIEPPVRYAPKEERREGS